MINTTERSTILLVCLGLDSDKTEIKKIGVEELREMFDEFGRLVKVIIFTRKIILKAFVEYETFEIAERAKNAIHETFVKNYGKARLYFSPQQNLKFSNKYLEFWENVPQEKPQSMDDDMSTKLSLKHSVSLLSHKLSLRKENCQFFPQAKTQVPKAYQLFSNSIDTLDLNLNKDSFLSSNNLVFSSQPCILSTVSLNSQQSLFAQLERSPDSYPDSAEEEVTSVSNVVLVSNLAHVFKSAEEIFNLFSAFGNIAKILFMVNLQKALIEYTELGHASNTITNLNNLTLGETKLRVNFSKHRKIDLQKNNKNENSMNFNQVLIVSPMRHRYRSNAQPSLSHLSTTLLISFPKVGGVEPIDIFFAIQKICAPTTTKTVSKKAFVGKTEIVNLLFTFKDIQSAVYVMYKCHNIIVKGSLLDIFFF